MIRWALVSAVLLAACAPCAGGENVRVRVTRADGSGIDDAVVTCVHDGNDVEAVHVDTGTWTCTGGTGAYVVRATRGAVTREWRSYSSQRDDDCRSPLTLRLELVLLPPWDAAL